MFNSIHRKLGTVGFIIAIVALVTALGGGAYAAGGGLNGKQKKEVKKIAKSVSKPGKRGKNGQNGQNGANGAVGPVGPAGAKGDTGAKGPEGARGAQGAQGPAGPACPEGDCFLPSKASETGTFADPFENEGPTAISFSLPLRAPIAAANVRVVAEGATAGAECDNGAGEAPSAANPEADPGFLCVFVSTIEGENGSLNTGSVLNPTTFGTGAGRTGAVLIASAEGAGFAVGTFAVTAP